jgi:serine/threonine protein kinase
MEKFTEDLSKILANTEEDNKYVVLEVLKEGSYSRVEKVSKDGSVFIRKYFHEGQKAFNELSRLARLEHTALPHIYDSYRLADRTAVIEEYIEGRTLSAYVKQNKKLSLNESVRLTLELCEAVTFLHSQLPPIIHRDIKPSNIICTAKGIKLIDFNIARVYNPDKDRDTIYMGTAEYAPPEQFGFGQTDMRSDIYSIGKTFLFMITGAQPTRHLDKTMLRALPDIIQKIISVSTNFTPQFRYDSVNDMIEDLKSAKDAAKCHDATTQPSVHPSIQTPRQTPAPNNAVPANEQRDNHAAQQKQRAPAPAGGHQLQKYEPLWGTWYIDSLIGEGSYGKVYKIYREELGKTHYSAVKFISIPQKQSEIQRLKVEGLDDESIRAFFHKTLITLNKEIDLMSEFRGNSHIVSFEDYQIIKRSSLENPGITGSSAGSPELANRESQTCDFGWDILIRMELLKSLSSRIAEKPLTHPEILKLGIHISRALELCALKNIVHRDIKPENIFISQYNEFKLGDFGVSRQIDSTISGLSKQGTYTYMAPEVFKGEKYGAGVDIYGLGILLYGLLNHNRNPFMPEYPQPILPEDRDASIQRRMNGEPIPDLQGADPRLNAIVLKACAYDRKERFSSPTEMREALETVAGIKGYAPEIAADNIPVPIDPPTPGMTGTIAIEEPSVISGQTSGQAISSSEPVSSGAAGILQLSDPAQGDMPADTGHAFAGEQADAIIPTYVPDPADAPVPADTQTPAQPAGNKILQFMDRRKKPLVAGLCSLAAAIILAVLIFMPPVSNQEDAFTMNPVSTFVSNDLGSDAETSDPSATEPETQPEDKTSGSDTEPSDPSVSPPVQNPQNPAEKPQPKPDPPIQIVSAQPNKTTGTTKDRFNFTVKTNVPASRVEFRFAGDPEVYYVNSDGSTDEISSRYSIPRSVSPDKMTWTYGDAGYYIPKTQTITVTAYDSNGKRSESKSFTITVVQGT